MAQQADLAGPGVFSRPASGLIRVAGSADVFIYNVGLVSVGILDADGGDWFEVRDVKVVLAEPSVPAGGYAADVRDTVDIHVATVDATAGRTGATSGDQR